MCERFVEYVSAAPRPKGDRFGYFTSKEKWPLDQPGVWTYTINATWNGFKGRVPGLVDQGGYIFVLENVAPGGPGMTLNLSRAADLLDGRRPGDSREQQRFRRCILQLLLQELCLKKEFYLWSTVSSPINSTRKRAKEMLFWKIQADGIVETKAGKVPNYLNL